MNSTRPSRSRLPRWALILATGVLTAVGAHAAAVKLTEDSASYTLDNGQVTAMISKESGDLLSLRYKGVEMLATFLTPNGQPDLQKDPPGDNPNGINRGMTDHQYGYWSHDAMGPHDTAKAIPSVTIDPKANDGARGEVSIKGISNGRKMGTGPGANGGEFISDIEIRYALGRDDSGLYTYSIFDHRPEYASTTLGEARFCVKLADMFDWMMIDDHHHMHYGPELERNGDDKYNYTSVQFEHPAYGWASADKKTGCFFINPTTEYLSGGPTKVEFLCHRDTNRVTAPVILNYWRSSHYGGSSVDVAQGESWTKVIGPFLIYMNSGGDPEQLWKDAIAQQKKENKKWPFDWVNGVDYPHRDERSTVSGRLVLQDPQAPSTRFTKLRVGLAYPDYHVTTNRAPAGNTPADITWMTDAKHYEFWVNASADGRFEIPAVRPGTYTLHAIADGVLGEFAQTELKVEAAKPVDLGKLTWTPVRHGRQLWEVGFSNRNGSEFAKGDDYFHAGMGIVYAQMFPHDVNFVVGQSNPRQDWYFQHVPHATSETVAAFEARQKARASAMSSPPPPAAPVKSGAPRAPRPAQPPLLGDATPWAIHFDLPATPQGTVTLRVAIAGGNTRGIAVDVNGSQVGKVAITGDSTVGRNGIQGLWYERSVVFPASALKAGQNVLTLTVPAGSITEGVVYDYLRLELDETAKTPASE